MSRRHIDELTARVRQLERVNEALLQANEQLKVSGNSEYWQAALKNAQIDMEAKDRKIESLKSEINQEREESAHWRSRYHAQSRNELVEMLEEETRKLRGKIICMEAKLNLAEAHIATMSIERPSYFSGLTHEIWRRLVQLCHPDRHNGSQASTEATRWLMENRP
jgi:DNA repair exonuclease SbcCD ATPase subunit